jgi:hypothetical protein
LTKKLTFIFAAQKKRLIKTAAVEKTFLTNTPVKRKKYGHKKIITFR